MPEAIFEAAIDSLMNQKKPNQNYGPNPTMTHQVSYDVTGKIAWYRAIANFDVSDLAGAAINSAKLVRELYSISNGGQDARLSRCTRPEDWTEGGVTWNRYDGVNNWMAVGGDYDDVGPPAAVTYPEPSTVGTHEISGLKPFVQDALASRNGIVSIITRLANEDPGITTRYLWRAKEHGADVWRLVVDYEPVAVSGRQGAAQIELPSARVARPASPARPARGARPARLHERSTA